MVAHVVRFSPGYRLVRDVIESGRLGAPLAASAARLHAGSGNIAWIRDVAQSGGVTVDLLVHDYDQLNAILGTAVTAYASVIAERSVNVFVDYGNGCVADVSGSTAMPAGYRFSTLLRVRCVGGVIEYATGELGDGDVVRVWPQGGGAERMPVPGADAYAEQARYFLRCLDLEIPVAEGTGAQALEAAALAAAALRSTVSGKVEAIGR
jgi:myo-inositol 2-dehydrogenase / D-chiro-inositol 1-dehydrogenase